MSKLSLALLLLSVAFCSATVSFRAGVVHHRLAVGSSVSDTLSLNLDLYDEFATSAASEGVEMLVYPEFGLGPESFDSRDETAEFSEDVPDISDGVELIPCDTLSPEDAPITVRMSCAARENNMYLAVNLYDKKTCDRLSDRDCPRDGFYLWNAEIILGPRGELVAKYYKNHLWYGKIFDTPEPHQVTFETPFGTFGIFICFDIAFMTPAVDMVREGIEMFIYPVAMDMWAGAKVHEAWSSIHESVLLASNMGGDWSGIYDNGVNVADKVVSLTSHPEEKFSVGTVNSRG